MSFETLRPSEANTGKSILFKRPGKINIKSVFTKGAVK